MFKRQATSSIKYLQRRASSTVAKTATATAESTGPFGSIATTTNAKGETIIQQAPNRVEAWSPSQVQRHEIFSKNVRFVGVDMGLQPNSLAAIDLIKQKPVSYIHDRIAVCSGTDFSQGHPKVYINLDKDKVSTCGYCGNRYAREDLKGKLDEE
ncbi:unnamed protein product [Ambrosiozyma monospora]|uniref:Unnamed protein product n=1 Tax=Ambrosiozyma monospora TaxID=43982 RepID=A0ACB5SZW1_AMBMO|nr:unnamed protein product [Ambrosiozyma monospora]